ncbi:MAG: hypothetical protein FK733_10895 [Asgard group archaeon]|nr:hypothetical protein [Asgard group archaeon]
MKVKKQILTALMLFSILVVSIEKINLGTLADTSGDSPLPMYHQEMIYDVENNQTIMFGGSITGGSSADLESTWVLSSINLTWNKLQDANSPGGRYSHRMVYNTLTGKILLFGGITYAAGAQVNDTWEFDPATNQWTELHPANAPAVRAAHGMYFDPDFNEVVLHAGVNSPTTVNDEVWIYNFSANNWTQLFPTGGPGTGYGHSFLYDEINKVGVLFGGRFADHTLKNDVWFFNRSSVTWTKKIPILKPLERYHLSMAYNPSDDTFVIFGGDNDDTPSRALDDTWVYNPQTNQWTEINTNLKPPARCKHKMIYDQYLNKIIMFGGTGEAFSVSYNDMWIYDPVTETWSQELTSTVPVPLLIIFTSLMSAISAIHYIKKRREN